MIGHETIYTHIWRDKGRGGQLYRHPRCAAKQRGKRHHRYDSRGRLAGQRHISARPALVEARATVGHWELDTVVAVGAKDCVATVVERKTGFSMLGKLANRGHCLNTRPRKRLGYRTPEECFYDE